MLSTRGAFSWGAGFFIFWSLFRCSQDATLLAGMCVCVSLSFIAVTSGLAARRIEV